MSLSHLRAFPSLPAASEPPPDDLESELRRIAQGCYDGQEARCDELAERAGPGYREFREFGRTCGNLEAEPVTSCLRNGGREVESSQPSVTSSQTPVDAGTVIIVQQPAGVEAPVTPSNPTVPLRYKPYDAILRSSSLPSRTGVMRRSSSNRICV